MAYCKVEFNTGFTVISNELMRDKRISLKAKGLQALILSLPPEWDKEKVTDHDEAEKIRRDCDGKQAHVDSVKTERKTVNPPKLYDLTTLQREANRMYGFTAQQTLDYTQSLYEMKLCTYPRTDSCYLTEDMRGTAETIADMVLLKFPHFMNTEMKLDVGKVLNSTKARSVMLSRRISQTRKKTVE